MGLITQQNNHVFVSGLTRSGKTYFVGRALDQIKKPVLFFNMQDEILPDKFIKVKTSEINMRQLIKALKTGCKIDLRIPINAKTSNQIIGYILENLLDAGFDEQNYLYVVIDECHLLKKNGLEKSIECATRGLKRGVRCIYVTQRPALCDKTLYTQSAEQYLFFLTTAEKEYLKTKGINYDECFKMWKENGKYSYIFYDGFKMEGRKAVS